MEAVAVLDSNGVVGEAVMTQKAGGVLVQAIFTKLPKGKHGFHIHKAGDLRGVGCMGACEHFHKGPPCSHGDRPGSNRPRHTGDLGNIDTTNHTYSYFLKHVTVKELLGRSLIVHGDEDDLGLGDFPDSKITGHSGGRIACGIIGRALCKQNIKMRTKTRKVKH
jgi:Cu-Zn family superoxide dismutase